MRIVSWNIRKAVGLDWRRSPARILSALDDLAPDVVLLQEADKRIAPRPAALPFRLIEAHERLEWLRVADTEVSLGWHGNAILLREGLQAECLSRLTLPGLEPRGAVIARVGDLLLAGCHLGLRRADRRRQVDVILREAERFGIERLVMGGDFNEWQMNPLLGTTYHALSDVTPGPTFHASRPMVALDHFVLGPDLRAKGSGVWGEAPANRASDHLPIWVDL
ncbi:endonuclease/exonuclease/phosphatase family metal-dependent hydrolase [Hasllibacter halocynthiae]|uniref:Endonuclease/exonuclease/phosphatase family metal-dependent hydrolase n=1 Tax=Hasllibacter halocynthiae TaxID=595589 RepID=A0A2T0X2G2_9RHOB|nr:endonuclease/exonuclease/phosphatase family protein [Hasllibacter halocynthiae]PRY93139.1 endonuclease/exonuclease/phosphatase family metal-dependent hydrolase [Hasllibacter halocynthiae]